MSYFCCDQARREVVMDSDLNGIDFLEVLEAPAHVPKGKAQKLLEIHFLKPLSVHLNKENVRMEGGERIMDIAVIDMYPSQNLSSNVWIAEVDRSGDFSTYTLRLVRSSKDLRPPDSFDPILSRIRFSFKAGCTSDLDCSQETICNRESGPVPHINYLAKDYASFRQIMIDRISSLVPGWMEQNASDLGIVLVEMLAYVGDYLSYTQDAVATEAYLGTARRRVSVRRHARLVDYFMHDGCNSRAWVQIKVSDKFEKIQFERKPSNRIVKFLTVLQGFPTCIPISEKEKAMDLQPEVFEPLNDQTLFKDHNRMSFHTWGSEHCCLPMGSTGATLKGSYPFLKVGDVLIFKEVRGPKTGIEEDADPNHRHAVRLTVSKAYDGKDAYGNPIPLKDPAFKDVLITEIEWGAEDALPFSLCLRTPFIDEVSVALGNIVQVDYGETITVPADQSIAEEEITKPSMKESFEKLHLVRENLEYIGTMPRSNIIRVPLAEQGGCTGKIGKSESSLLVPSRFRPHLLNGPLTQVASYEVKDANSNDKAPAYFDPEASALSATRWGMKDVLPFIIILDSDGHIWYPKRDLISGGGYAFVVEVEDDGTSAIRFGDGTYGERPREGVRLYASYRVGNGARGNVGAESLAHLITDVQGIEAVTNPMPARGGIEPESIEDVRLKAPFAFRSQERAVTPEDYEMTAQRYPGVQKAVATFRWTGSWNTVFITADRIGGQPVDSDFKAGLRNHIERFRLTGHDIEIDEPRRVPLEVEMHVTLDQDYSRSQVKTALLEIFSNRDLPNGKRGVFHPDNFTFGQSVFLSPLYKEAQTLPGITSVKINKFQRQGGPDDGAADSGELKMGRLEIACLDNDPNFPDRGTLNLIMEGGRW
jgi:hypothetical protein